MKDSQANRKLQRDLAEQSQLQMYIQYSLFLFYTEFKLYYFFSTRTSGAYLYRKERKKRKCSSTSAHVVDAKIPFRPSSDDGSSCSSLTPGSLVEDMNENMPSISMNQFIYLLIYYENRANILITQ